MTMRSLALYVARWARDLGAGSLFYLDANEEEAALPIGDEDQVFTVVSGLPAWADATGASANDKARGFGGQIGNLVDPITAAGYGVTVYAPWDGAITEIILRADASCDAVVDVLQNGVSIFTGTSVKPTLSASQTDDKTDMTDITVDFVKGDRFDIVLDSVASDPALLSLRALFGDDLGMANIIATNFGEFSTAGTNYFENNTTGATMTFSSAGYANFWSNGAGQSLSLGGAGSAGYVTKNVPSAAEYYAHNRVRAGAAGAALGLLAFNETGTNHIQVLQLNTGVIEVRRNGTVLATGTTVFSTLSGRVLSVQARVVVHDSTGVVQVRIDGATSNEINFSGDTRNGATGVINQIGLYQSATNENSSWTDFIVNDTTGGVADSWTGAARVVLGAFTVSGGSGQQFTPSASTNVSNIDDVVPGLHDSDTTYNESSTAAHKDWFQLASSVFTGMSPASISFVRTKYWARAADGGTHTMRSNAKNGGTTTNGATITLGSSYVLNEDVFYNDPNTAAAWATFAAIYGAEFGYELVS